SFSGNKVGLVTACGTGADANPLASVRLVKGVAKDVEVQLIKAFGTVTLWVEEKTTRALGSSDVIYFAQPTIPDVQTPFGIDAMPQPSTLTYCSPWNGRHVII